jgi:hypothetical protein
MSVNPDDMNMASGVATEFVDLEHQVIRQKANVESGSGDIELLPGDPAAEFEPGERQLDREEIAQLVVYRRSATINWLSSSNAADNNPIDNFAIVDASVGINGDLFRPVTTQESFTVGPDNQTVLVDTGGEIGLLDNYQIYAQPQLINSASGPISSGGIAQRADLTVNFYDYPTGGPIVDSFDTITCGFGAGFTDALPATDAECQFELRYDFWWDVAEQGRSTNPFGRPSTR